MGKFIISNHAKERMALRGISMNMIKDTILKSERSGIGKLDRLLAFKSFPRGLLKVIYVKERGINFIVSVIWEKIN